MNCNLNRSMAVGFVTMLIMGIIILIWLNMRDSSITYSAGNILLFAAVLFIIGSAMDYFNQCYTTCKNFGSSLTFGAFTVAIIYLFFGLFVANLEFDMNLVVAFILNALIIGGIHYVTCDDIHKDRSYQNRSNRQIMRNNYRRYSLENDL
jgi:hypothetical protein